MNNQYLVKVIQNDYVVFLHNGYAEFSYGVSLNPIKLCYDEYKKLMLFISKADFRDKVDEFENSQNYDFKIPEKVAKMIGYTLITLSPPLGCIYDSKEKELLQVREKEKLLLKIT